MLVKQGEVFLVKGKFHCSGLTRGEVNFAKIPQLTNRACHAGDIIAQVELDDLVSAPWAGIGHCRLDIQRLGRGEALGAEPGG